MENLKDYSVVGIPKHLKTVFFSSHVIAMFPFFSFQLRQLPPETKNHTQDLRSFGQSSPGILAEQT